MRVVIDRATWLRGEGWRESSLLRGSDGKRCCLGFLGSACGIADVDMTDTTSPVGTHRPNKASLWPLSILEYYSHTGTCQHLMRVNDDVGLSEVLREMEIIELFRSIDIEVSFSGR